MRNWVQTIGAGVLCVLMASTAAWADVQVKAIQAGWQVDAQNEPLTSVLNTIGKKAGIKVSGTTKLIENPNITAVYEGSLDTVLRRLLRGADYAFETVADDDGNSRITRLVVLSGTKGRAPSARAVNTARKLPAPRSTGANLTAEERSQGARVTSLLTQRAALVAGVQGEAVPEQASDETQNPASSGITRNTDGTFDITPEAQARMAEATRRAQQDLQALVSAIRRNEDNQGGGD